MLGIAFAGTFAARFEEPVRARLHLPCEVVVADEAAIVSTLADIDVLVTLAFSREMAAAARRLKLVQVPGAGLDGIDRSALPAGMRLANASSAKLLQRMKSANGFPGPIPHPLEPFTRWREGLCQQGE